MRRHDMIRGIFSLLIALLFAAPVRAQQVADTGSLPVIEEPAYPLGEGPVVLIDEAHHNFHTVEGRYKPFAQFLRQDGYVVQASTAPFRREVLGSAAVLVIANALHERNRESWALPTPSAFTEEEIEAVRSWVEEGGALFLIADHMPFPGAAADLAAAFGVSFNNGYAFESGQGTGSPLIFRRADGTLTDHVITNGRSRAERVDSVATFTGQAFEAEAGVEPLMILRAGSISLMPDTAWVFDAETPRVDVGGWLQGAVRSYGRGRVAVFGEAAQFSAQVQGPERIPMGMNAPVASRNPQFLLNLMHWLSGLLE